MNGMGVTANALMRAGLDLFPKKGYKGTSIRDIIRRARTNLGAVTYHFGTKEALYYAVIELAAAPYRSALNEAADGPGTPIDRLGRLVKANVAYLDEHADFRQLLLQQLVEIGPLAPAALTNLQTALSIVIGLITEGQMDGSIRSGDARLLAMTVVAQPLSMCLTAPIMRSTGTIDLTDPATKARAVANAVRFVQVGLATKPQLV